MNIKLNLPAEPFSGQIVTFTAPCDCINVTDGLSINGKIYTICDALGKCVTGVGGAWSTGAQVSVILDCTAKKAYIQNNSNYAPAGFGLGTLGKTVYSLSEIKESGFYIVISDEMPNENGWSGYVTMSSINCGGGILCSRGLMIQVTKDGGVWQPYVSCTPSSFAPSGYGLGAFVYFTGPIVDNPDNAVNTGWYAFYNLDSTIMMGYTNGVIEVISYTDLRNKQVFYPNGTNYVLERYRYEGAWQPWEWVNPPMLLGIEYRTTERHNGKPVYRKVLDVGTMPNAATAQVDHGISDVDEIFLVKGSMTNANNTVSIPYYESAENVVGVSAQRHRVVVTATGNASLFTGVVHLKYTKTTD